MDIKEDIGIEACVDGSSDFKSPGATDAGVGLEQVGASIRDQFGARRNIEVTRGAGTIAPLEVEGGTGDIDGAGVGKRNAVIELGVAGTCLLYTSPSPRDRG